ncbi:bifunctional phosphoserine phosphatase/homoserine phosphotransferase ThrH [Rhizobium lemnae]|uniref:phosphoserine phosphatase n=1 Tax=Rhizobium lemnae TaxID=1214924 RepID=A0ABV8ECU4_9HYPH|nr:bifunctional phosphoserine phosphatase/homoserine phosphotransferase ThrH [Rhizobium lemnae]MCJ8509245.1 bifunctional phosphoserine phosphatase/homoserine phosphotransferase ThrH [Rhizobium lemnae]
MTQALCSFVDLEGVLAPEMWPYLARRFSVAELEATTRTIPDYRQLLEQRILALARHRITLAQICEAVRGLDLLQGAQKFISALKQRGQLVLVTDSFQPMNSHFLNAIGADLVLCHTFTCNDYDIVTGFDFWNGLKGKHLCFDMVKTQGRSTFAIGDAFNDLSMLRRAQYGVLFQPSRSTREAAPDLQSATTYGEVLSYLDSVA